VSDVEALVRKSIAQHDLVQPGETIVVGVSGGPDSLCLLHVLRSIKDDYGLDLHVAHLHHGLRGREADADAEMVRARSEAWSLPCTVERTDVPALAREHHLAIEEAARRARYSFLSRVAETAGSFCIAVGHNADDQAETILMHWIRGSGLGGLRGMLPVMPLCEYRLVEPPGTVPLAPGVRLVRPLLEVPRIEIEAYCTAHGLEPRFDRSNLDTTYFRNWLRHEVLPLLESHNPNVRETMRRSARVLADDYTLLRSLLLDVWTRIVHTETPEHVVLDLEGWRALPISLQRSTIRESVQRLRRTLRDVTFVQVENAVHVARDGTTGAQSTLPQGLMLRVGYNELTIGRPNAVQALPDWPLLAAGSEPVQVEFPGRTPLPESTWQLEIRVRRRADLPPDWESNNDPWRAFVDAERVGAPVWLRTRQAGDRFHPLGMGGRVVKLSDFLTNRKIPHSLRDRLPLLADGRGIVWVCGQRIDHRARIRDATEAIWLLRLAKRGAG